MFRCVYIIHYIVENHITMCRVGRALRYWRTAAGCLPPAYVKFNDFQRVSVTKKHTVACPVVDVLLSRFYSVYQQGCGEQHHACLQLESCFFCLDR